MISLANMDWTFKRRWNVMKRWNLGCPEARDNCSLFAGLVYLKLERFQNAIEAPWMVAASRIAVSDGAETTVKHIWANEKDWKGLQVQERTEQSYFILHLWFCAYLHLPLQIRSSIRERGRDSVDLQALSQFSVPFLVLSGYIVKRTFMLDVFQPGLTDFVTGGSTSSQQVLGPRHFRMRKRWFLQASL